MSYGRYSSKSYGSSYLSDSSSRLSGYRSQIASPLSGFESSSASSGISSYRINSPSPLGGVSSNSYLSSTIDKSYMGRSSKQSDLGTSFGSKYGSSLSYGTSRTLDYKASSGLESRTPGFSSSYLSKSGRETPSYRSSTLTSPSTDLNYYSSSNTSSYSTGSHSTYRTPTREYGANYSLRSSPSSTSSGFSSLGSTSGQHNYTKSSTFNLTPFETRRNTHATDYHHVSSLSSTRRSPPTTTTPALATTRTTVSSKREESPVKEQPVDDSKIKNKISERRLSESSDSFDESSDVRDHNMRYLTNRATSPLEVDELDCSNSLFDRNKYKTRNRLMARKKTKAYPISDRTRRRQLKNANIQVDVIDLDVSSGRMTPAQAAAALASLNNKKPTKPKAQDKIPSKSLEPKETTAAPTSTASETAPIASKTTTNQTSNESSSPKISTKKQVVTPKQSGFVPKTRKSFVAPQQDDNSTQSNDKPLWRKNLIEKQQLQQAEQLPDVTPKQSSFAGKQWKNKFIHSSQNQVEDNSKSTTSKPQLGSSLTLKESLEKVRKWKKQFAETQARIKNEEEAETEESIFGKDDWKKKKVLQKNSTLPAGMGLSSSSPIKTSNGPLIKGNDHNISKNSNTTKPASLNSLQPNKDHTTRNSIDNCNNYNISNNITSLPDLSKVGDVDKHKKSPHDKILSMLPDLISSSEEKLMQTKQGGFISKMKDIDSLLGYDDEEEEERLNEDKKLLQERNKNTENNDNINKLTPFEQALADLNLFGSDIDADTLFPQPFIPDDFAKSVVVSKKQSIKDDNSRDEVKPKVEKFEMSSCESILDAPVPATPDLPLFPIQAFQYPPSIATQNGKKSASENVLNTEPHLEDLEKELGLQNLKNKSESSESESDKESSSSKQSNSADTSSSKQSNTGNTSDSSEQKIAGNGLTPRAQEVVKDSRVTSARLIDIDSDEDDQHRKPQNQIKVYSKNYSDVAISRALTYQRNSGHVPMEAILKICRLTTDSRNDKRDENRKLVVFEEVDEALESLGVDVKKLEDCCIALHERGINEIYLKVIVPNIGNKSDEVHSQLVRHKLALRAKVAALLEKIKISTIPTLEVILYSLKDLFKKSEEFLRAFIDLRGINQILELVITFSSRTHNNSHRGHCLDHLCIRAMTQILFSSLGMRILARDDKFIKWLMTFVLVKHPKELTSASLLMMSLMMRGSDVSASIIFKLMMIHSKKNETNLWCQLIELLKTDSTSEDDGDNVKDLDCNCLHFINSLLKMLPDADSSLDFSDHLEELDFEKHVHLRSYTTQKKSLQDLFTCYEEILKEIDALEMNSASSLSNGAPNGLVRKKPPRNPHRKSRRYSKWREVPVIENQKTERKPTIQPETAIEEQKSHISKRTVTLHFQDQIEEQTNEIKTSKPDDDVCFSGLLEKAKVGLMSKKSSEKTKIQSTANEREVKPKPPDKPVHEKQWEQALEKPVGTLKVKEMDFTDLTEVDELNYLDSQPIGNAPPGFKGGLSSLKPLTSKAGRHQEQVPFGCPPPPPLALPPFSPFSIPPPPPFPAPLPPPGLPTLMGLPPTPLGFPPPPPPPGLPPAPLLGLPFPPRLPPIQPAGLQFPSSGDRSYSLQPNLQGENSKRTIKLHWKEARAEFYTPSGRTMETIWGRVAREVGAVKIEKKKFEELFETKTMDVKIKKIELSKKVTVLDSKRSNAINIALTSLPPVATIKTAILKMDGSVLSKEGIEKILNTMLPTEEEVARITEVQIRCSDEVILGSAEQFLVSISTISEVKSRLRLWLFIVEFDTIEADITSHVSDLKLSIKQLKSSQTLKYALMTLLAIGNCLNNVKTQGFTMDYLEKVSEVKDVTRKHSLFYHLVSIVIDQHGNEVTDLFSDLEAVHRCAKISWDDISEKLTKLEEMCKSSWEDLRKVSMHESNPAVRKKLSETLSDLAERIILLKLVFHRLNRRFGHLLLYFGYPAKSISEVKINSLLKIISDFSVEFKQTREKILKHKQKKEAKEMKILQQHRLKMVQHLTSKSEYKIESQDETDDGIMVSSWIDPDFKTTKSTSLGQLGNSYSCTSEAETGDEELIEAACRSALRPSRNKKRYNYNSDKLHSSWKESLANRDRSVY